MNKPVLWLIALALLVAAVPLAIWMKFESNSLAEKRADPAYQQQVEIDRMVLELAAPDRGTRPSTAEMRRAVSLLDVLSGTYDARPMLIADEVIGVRRALAEKGIEQPCIPIMEALGASSLKARGTFSVMLAGYSRLRLEGNDHATTVRKLGG